MNPERRMYKLSDTNFRNVNLKNYEDIIINTINTIAPNKNPKVYETYFETDELTQSQAVRLGQALSRTSELKQYCKKVIQYRLFTGKITS